MAITAAIGDDMAAPSRRYRARAATCSQRHRVSNAIQPLTQWRYSRVTEARRAVCGAARSLHGLSRGSLQNGSAALHARFMRAWWRDRARRSRRVDAWLLQLFGASYLI
jgi:hypothetical protein